MARGICKDDYLADDLVSDMYLKLAAYNKDVNDYYVYYTIKHLFINHLREEKRFANIEAIENLPHDEAEMINPNRELPECLTWVEKQILLLRTEKSGRDIEKQYHINYQKVHRIENKAKAKVKAWVKSQEQAMLLPQLQSL